MANIPSWVYKLLIVLATIIWGFSFVVMKDVVAVLPPAWLLGMRFLFAGALLLVILRKRVMRFCSRKVVTYGFILGALDFTAFWLQTVGLKHTTPGINAFLTATYCVLVPFAWWLIARKRPTAFNIIAAIVAVCGIWLVSVSSSGETLSIGFGEAMTLGCAVAFAAHIVAVSKFAQKCDALVLTVFQFIAEGALGIVFGAATETFPGIAAFTPEIIGQMLFLAVFASVVAFGIQNVSLAHVPPTQVSLLLSLESVFGVVFSILLYGEQMTLRLVVGFVLIFAAIVISETLPLKENPCRRKTTSS